MKAITLWQPWASFMAEGLKRIETRSWPAPKALIGERVAIHAAARMPSLTRRVAGGCCDRRNAGLVFARHSSEPGIPLPLGKVVASGVLDACVPMIGVLDEKPRETHVEVLGTHEQTLWLATYTGDMTVGDLPAMPSYSMLPLSEEWPYGEWAPGRWAWLFSDLAPVQARCPWCCGDGIDCSPYATDAEFRPCPVCNGATRCEPIPAKGGQRIWNWYPA